MSIEARVLKEEMQEGSPLFTFHAYLPAEASYGFASFVIHVDLNSLSLGKRRAKKKSAISPTSSYYLPKTD